MQVCRQQQKRFIVVPDEKCTKPISSDTRPHHHQIIFIEPLILLCIYVQLRVALSWLRDLWWQLGFDIKCPYKMTQNGPWAFVHLLDEKTEHSWGSKKPSKGKKLRNF